MLYLFSFFHLNLAFSSIEEELRPEVIHRCYRPLLRMAKDLKLPLGIEASGYTLEEIQRLAPDWVSELRNLCKEGRMEFIGSGYAQLIGPLVPSAVNWENQKIGLKVYRDILGFEPRLVLVSEQAYSSGLVPIYREAGYQAMIMEWDNAGSAREGWNPDWRYLPQKAIGADGSTLPVIWNKSIPFQKFQRYGHSEMELPEYFDFLAGHVGREDRTFSLYGNDAEIFDFRPGRFTTEPTLGDHGEWQRISGLYETLQADGRFTLIQPGQVLDFLKKPGAGNALHLESSARPVIVKKQAKYNIMRWALTGRDDLGLNTSCWRLFDALSNCDEPNESDWKELCFLWSSDFRTHITKNRWQKVQAKLGDMQKRLPWKQSDRRPRCGTSGDGPFTVLEKGSFLEIETPEQRLRLNCRRGLAIDSWWDKFHPSTPLIKTLEHGYFDDIHYSADFYTGHLVLEIPGQHKITDLSSVAPKWEIENDCLVTRADIRTSLGIVGKELQITSDQKGFEISYNFHWPVCPNGSLRLGHITLNPEAFEEESLFYRTHNGGSFTETFHLRQKPVNHLAPVSSLVSVSHGLGVTSGLVELGDRNHCLTLEIDKCTAALTGHIVYAPVDKSFFYRLVFSAMEMDDTSCYAKSRTCFENRIVRLKARFR